MRIVYCLNSIRYLGGMPRVTINKANALADVQGNDVYVIVTDNKEGVQVQQLSNKVHLIDLDINYYKGDTKRSKLANYLIGQVQRRVHKKKLYEELCRIKPDVVISVGTSEKYMLLSMRNRTWKIMREFHHVRKNYRSKTANSLIEKVMAPILDFYEFKLKDKSYDRIVVLTEGDKEANWKGWDNVRVMPNPVSFQCLNPSPLNEKSIVAIGRLDPIKNFSSLINAFKIVSQKHHDWTLKIYGDGALREDLEVQINKLELSDNVSLMGFTNNIEEALSSSSLFVLSSITEGFPLVILEAMECGVPVVSYQCPYGPQDIISDAKDGFLVPVGDERMMADRICQLIEDEELRRKMGAAAKETAKQYHTDVITKQWMTLFDELVQS